MSHSSIGRFLRSRREQTLPAEQGLPATGRRRTPGLRREELALLANISVDYLVRLEQDRDVNPSAAVLSALSQALRLTQEERQYLTSLVAVTTQSEMCPEVSPLPTVDPTTRSLLEQLRPAPALVAAPWAEVLAWNDPYDRLMRPSGLFDRDPPNLARHTFLDEGSPFLYPDWWTVAREHVASLRAATTACHHRDALEEVIDELGLNSSVFSGLWASYEVDENRHGIRRMKHPTVGALQLEFESLVFADRTDRRLVTYFPTDEANARALDRLVHRDT